MCRQICRQAKWVGTKWKKSCAKACPLPPSKCALGDIHKSLIQNPSFDLVAHSMLNCAVGWGQAMKATFDFWVEKPACPAMSPMNVIFADVAPLPPFPPLPFLSASIAQCELIHASFDTLICSHEVCASFVQMCGEFRESECGCMT